jgi:hypothetical protein
MRYEELVRASTITMEEFAAVEEKWANISVPDRQEVHSIKDYAIYLNAEIAQLIATQPKCWLLRESYDNEFLKYKEKVDYANRCNRRALRILEAFSKVKKKLKAIQNDIELLRELKTKNKKFINEWLENYILSVFGRLGMLKIGFEKLSNETLEGQEELRKEFEKNNSILDKLAQPTHKWKPLEKSTVIIRPEWIPPEGSSMEPRKAEVLEYVTHSKCEKCSQQR